MQQAATIAEYGNEVRKLKAEKAELQRIIGRLEAGVKQVSIDHGPTMAPDVNWSRVALLQT